MVTKKDLDDGLTKLRVELTESLNKSILELREHVINKLMEANDGLKAQVKVLETKVVNLEKELQSSLQYNRLNNVVISGIPESVDHNDLKSVSLEIMNTCLQSNIGPRDMEACHRISKKSKDVVCRLVNREDVEEALANSKMLENINHEEAGLPNDTGNIYINVHLTPHNAKLAYHCRQLKKRNKVMKISTRKGIVKILLKGPMVLMAAEWSGELYRTRMTSPSYFTTSKILNCCSVLD